MQSLRIFKNKSKFIKKSNAFNNFARVDFLQNVKNRPCKILNYSMGISTSLAIIFLKVYYLFNMI